MNYEKTERLAALIMALAIIAILGMYINRNVAQHHVSVSSAEKAERVKVYVDGEVVNPGTYSVPKGSRICDVIYAAGGITPEADIDLIDLDALVMSESRIDVPGADSEAYNDIIPVININTADKDELMLIPGIGEVTADRIIDYRNTYGEFSQISDIKNVRGIGETKFSEIKDYIITPEINKTEG